MKIEDELFEDPETDGQFMLINPADHDELEFLKSGQGSPEQISRAREKVQHIASLLGAGLPWRKIQGLCKCSPHTILKVQNHYPELVEKARESLAGKFESIAGICADTLIDKLVNNEIPANLLAMIMGTSFDKAQLIRGKATTITSSTTPTDNKDLDRLRASIASLKKEAPGEVIEAETVDALDLSSSNKDSKNE